MSAYWAGDAIATNLARQADAVRANATLRRQQGFHCGDIAIQASALRELQRFDPDNPLFHSSVQAKIYKMAEAEFSQHGWDRGSSVQVDVKIIHEQLLAEFDNARQQAIATTSREHVKQLRRGWFFINRRTVFAWGGTEHATEDCAVAAKQAELVRLQATSLGDPL